MNAEAEVLQAIEDLEADDIEDIVDWQMSRYSHRSGYDFNVGQDHCELCRGEFHGLAQDGCPGAFCSDEERLAYQDSRSARSGWALADLEALRGGFVSHLAPTRDRPLVRFWAQSTDGLQLMEGTLNVADLSVRQSGSVTEYTVSGYLRPPITEQHWPIPEDADLTMEHTRWLSGDDPAPVGTIESGLITSEVDTVDGFQPIGYIAPEDIEIATDVDNVVDWGGRTIRTRQETTIEFSTWQPGPAFDRLLRR